MSKEAVLNNIRTLDPNVFDRLSDLTEESLMQVQANLVEYKANDKFPKTIPVKTGKGTAGGCANTFRYNFNAIDVSEFEDGKLVIGELTITTAIEVIKVLKCLLWTGICNDENLAASCRNLVVWIMRKAKDQKITKEDMLDALGGNSYYERTLSATIKELLNPEV